MDVGRGAVGGGQALLERERAETNAVAMTYGQQIDEQLKNAEQRVTELKRIQELLNENPQFEELLTLVGRHGRY